MGSAVMPSVCAAKASYKKAPGNLELSDTHLQWTPEGKNAPVVRVGQAEVITLLCSKEDSTQTRMKVTLVDDANGFTFTFTSPQAIARAEREKFTKELTTIIARNRATRDVAIRVAPVVVPPPTPISTSASNAPTPRPGPEALRPSASRAVSVASDRRNSPVISGYETSNDYNLRKKVLLSNTDLAALHKDLVMGGQITEAEFWDGREHLLLTQAAADKQKKGKPGQLVDPRPETVEGGDIKIRITPQLVHDIFDEYPVVAKAYSENIPSKLTEEAFWKRYFQSKLFNAHRASIRSSATQHVVKDDEIFDQYLEKDDDELEPRRQRNEKVQLLVDLAATLEDHTETGNERDITMQAGRQKGALPLIRKFNEHSERLLNSALGELPPAKRQRKDSDFYQQIDLDDLHDSESSAGIRLEMLDRQRYFEGRMQRPGGLQGKKLDARTMAKGARAQLVDWQSKLAQFKQERKPGDAAVNTMTQNVSARLETKSRKNDIPDGLFRQMTTCQTAANEFLRQYWSAIHPPPVDLPTVAIPTPAQRTAKAIKMISYLSKTPEKIAALVKVAQQHNVDPLRIETAMRPVLNAVNQALTYDRNKKPIRA
ncbi:hypothetical protein BDN72DRAFT_813870 [Pluteus cervinus]|uniref:Uncharacterized protein n=1 Tax=Pluteus cervinus TaxID=181527 RepID=A0ACD3B7W0_9AGAR|nr:hypothetical protein BDN72DRAFT_813870 [Pluteus cervinus]